MHLNQNYVMSDAAYTESGKKQDLEEIDASGLDRGSPPFFAQWEFAELHPDGLQTLSFAGDLPDWLYWIKALGALLPQCTCEDLTPQLLEEVLLEA